MNEVIKVVQLPVIEQRLRSMKEDIELDVSAALALDCTEETVKAVKAMRARLNKDHNDLDQQRKDVKKAVFAPWDSFEQVFDECVSKPYRHADALLKGKIDDVESTIKRRCEDGLREYFDELCVANHVEWLTFEQTGVKVDMASAKQKTPRKLREQLMDFVHSVRGAMDAISVSENAEEITVEYKHSLSLSEAMRTVEERRKRIEAEREDRARLAETTAREAEAVRKVEALAPPVQSEQPKIYSSTFTVHTTMDKLKKIKDFLNMEGIKYE